MPARRSALNCYLDKATAGHKVRERRQVQQLKVDTKTLSARSVAKWTNILEHNVPACCSLVHGPLFYKIPDAK